MKKHIILLFLVSLLFFLNVGILNPYPERLETMNEVDFTIINSSLTPIEQGVYNFTATFQNTWDDPTTTGITPGFSFITALLLLLPLLICKRKKKRP